ncbi:hypothetical protein AB5I41_00495 [Sphingomonas sp. MMS24-JH45]
MAVERGGLLIVERNPITRATLKALFADFAPIAFAGDAAEALGMAQAQAPLRILADLSTSRRCGGRDDGAAGTMRAACAARAGREGGLDPARRRDGARAADRSGKTDRSDGRAVPRPCTTRSLGR